jgi:hypothetical protein
MLLQSISGRILEGVRHFLKANDMKAYIQVVSFETEEVIHQIEITGKTHTQIERIDNFLNINLNHEKFYTREVEVESE